MGALRAAEHAGSTLGKWWDPNCAVHGTHRPANHSTEVHHIQPLGLGGPDTPDNRVMSCPNGHTHIHMLLDRLIDQDGVLTRDDRRGFARREVELAFDGYRRWVAAGRPRGRT